MNKLISVAALLSVPFLSYACSTDEETESTENGGTASDAGRPNASGGSTAVRGGSSGAGARGGASAVGGQSVVGGSASAGFAGRSGGTSGGVAGTPANGGNLGAGAGGSVGANAGAGQAGRAPTGGFGGLGAAPSGGAGNAGVAGESPIAAARAGTSGMGAGGRANAGSSGYLATGGIAGASTTVGGAASSIGGAAGAVSGMGGAAGAASGTGGAAGASNQSCAALCSSAACAGQPECLAAAYGYGAGDTIALCIPATAYTGVTICANTTCNGGAGCPMIATLGTTAWTLEAASTVGVTDVRLDTVVTNLTGPIGVTGAYNCTLNATLPTSGVPIAAIGTAAPAAMNASLVSLNFDGIPSTFAGLGVTSTNQTCSMLSGLLVGQAIPALRATLLDALNARAAQLVCADCRGDCPQQLACVAPAI